MRAFDGATPAEDIAAFADRARKRPMMRDDLVSLLPEQSPVYTGRSANEADRLRGYLMASFEATGLPPAAAGYVLEDLQSGIDPYTVAAAAKALRGAQSIAERAVPLLLAAIERIGLADDFVAFDSWGAAVRGGASTTALMELFRTLAWLGPRAGAAHATLVAMIRPGASFHAAVRDEIDKAIVATACGAAPAPACCHVHTSGPAPIARAEHDPPADSRVDELAGLELQDQDGTVLTFGEFFHGRPSVLTFFYTRCMNPNKCSLTVTRLARLQQRIRADRMQGRVNVAAISYDPAFDLPRRLHGYGLYRGMTFDAHNRILRSVEAFEPLRRRFDLGVGYGTVTVNRHSVELFVLDARGRTTLEARRAQWEEDDIVGALTSALAAA
jgi:cytochrome oxidase Cu insertion factor (SCO1/SenC/PrrC family)